MKYVVARLKKNSKNKYPLVWGQQIDTKDVVLLIPTLYSRKDSAMRVAKRYIEMFKRDAPILVLQMYENIGRSDRVYIIRAVIDG